MRANRRLRPRVPGDVLLLLLLRLFLLLLRGGTTGVLLEFDSSSSVRAIAECDRSLERITAPVIPVPFVRLLGLRRSGEQCLSTKFRMLPPVGELGLIVRADAQVSGVGAAAK